MAPADRRLFAQENSGNDPNTQLVPAGGGFKGSWQKTEEPQASEGDARGSGLTAGSTWAASGGRGPAQSWQPPEGPYLTSSAGSQRDRQLNPHDYPSLAAAATARPNFTKQPVPSVPFASHQVCSTGTPAPQAVTLKDPVLKASVTPLISSSRDFSGKDTVSTVRAGEQGSAAAWDEDERRFSSAAGGPPPADWCALSPPHHSQPHDHWNAPRLHAWAPHADQECSTSSCHGSSQLPGDPCVLRAALTCRGRESLAHDKRAATQRAPWEAPSQGRQWRSQANGPSAHDASDMFPPLSSSSQDRWGAPGRNC